MVKKCVREMIVCSKEMTVIIIKAIGRRVEMPNHMAQMVEINIHVFALLLNSVFLLYVVQKHLVSHGNFF